MSNDLINRKHCRDFILKKTESLRLGWDCKRVSQKAIDELEFKIRALIIGSVKKHPSIGKTFKYIQ